MMRAANIAAAAALTTPAALGAQAALSPAASAQQAYAQQAEAQEAADATVHHPGWESLSTRRDDRLGFELTGNPGRVAIDDSFNVGLKITNDTESSIEDVQVTARRGTEVRDAAAAQQQLAHGDFPYYGAAMFPAALAPWG